MPRHILFSSALLLAASSLLHAQLFTTGPCPESHGGWPGQSHACELRSTTLPLTGGELRVKGTNGGIDVVGEDRSDIALEARVEAHASSQGEANSLLREIRVTTAGTITADGSKSEDDRNWSVSYHLRVPHRLSAELNTHNGGLRLASLEGNIHGETTNGGVSLTNLAGDVRVTTTNGGVSVALAGSAWQGHGLFVRSTNGGLRVKLPASYSAHVLAQTTHGGIHGPFSNQPHDWRSNSIDTNLGRGGATIDLATTNGGILFASN